MKWALLLCVAAIPSLAQSVYYVSINTSDLTGQPAQLSFEMTSGTQRLNRADILDFSTDGELALPRTEGGLIWGDVILGLNPAPFTRIETGNFLNALSVPFDSLGERISFALNISESKSKPGQLSDLVSVSLLDRKGVPFPDPTDGGKSRLQFTVTINGKRGGFLELLGAYGGDIRPLTRILANAGSPLGSPDSEFTGDVKLFCTRRCIVSPSCQATEYGITTPDGVFLTFDDLGNLKARAALIQAGRDPADGVRVRVRGALDGKTIAVSSVEIL